MIEDMKDNMKNNNAVCRRRKKHQLWLVSKLMLQSGQTSQNICKMSNVIISVLFLKK